jgi:1-deoxy-D-xylulose-5-phosphate reductoisomerase
MARKKITILGSTGSIGTQTLDVISRHPEAFQVTALTCGKNVDLLRKQIRTFRPEMVCTAEEEDAAALKKEFPRLEVVSGKGGLIEAAEKESGLLVNSLMGMRGMVPTYHAIQSGKDIALANKETLVTGGHLIMDAVKKNKVNMLPVDSEHSAIFQCLQGNKGKKIRRILLTASGGPFRGWNYSQLKTVTPEMALKHPNWKMGRKITIDSATMMNKGLEMIEAKWLFHVDIDDIQVLVHPQSIVHSAVEFDDTTVIAQMGKADMRIPISVALGYPERLHWDGEGLDFFHSPANQLTFEEPDTAAFRCLPLAVSASKEGGSCPAVMNAANEVLVQAFLDHKIGFTDIPESIEKIMQQHHKVENPDLTQILEIDEQTREKTYRDFVEK